MPAQLQGVRMAHKELGQVKGVWASVQAHNGARLQTQLLFNRALPTSAANRATRVGPPPPILIEKLVPEASAAAHDAAGSAGSSLCFSVLSEERLEAAVRMAKRDLRRRRHQLVHGVAGQRRSLEHHQDTPVSKQRERASSTKEEVTRSGAKVRVYTPQKLPPPKNESGRSPPTRDPGPGNRVSIQEPQLSREIRRLQKELGTYIQRVEQLCDRGRLAEELQEPEEARRAEIRRQGQAARSARIIYMLQRQVKEIQEDLEKLCSQQIKHTKKSRAMDRLAAAHRGAVRALQLFVSQLSHQSDSRMPSHYKELGQLIRQLSLCSAKMEAGRGSSVPETTIDILQRLEALDTALSEREKLQMRDAVEQNSPRVGQNTPKSSPARETAGAMRRARKPANLRKNLPEKRRTAPRPQDHNPVNPSRSEVLRAGLESLIHTRQVNNSGVEPREDPQAPNHLSKPRQEQREELLLSSHLSKPRADQREEPQVPDRPKGVLLPKNSKGAPPRHVGFQQPTVSSRLKESQPAQRDTPVPWIPASPHTSPLRSTAVDRPEPRCLFSVPQRPESPEEGPAVRGEVKGRDAALSPEKTCQARSEALRQAWLEKETSRRLKQLSQLSREEAEGILRLRSKAPSPTHWAEDAEREARNRLQPLLDRVQLIGDAWDRQGASLRHQLSQQAVDKVTGSAELLSEAILEDLLEDTVQALWEVEQDRQVEELAQHQLQIPTLQDMLLRMEEMERDQDAVRRRFTHISYSDPRFWPMDQDAGPRRETAGSRPASPQAIRLTRPTLKQPPMVDIHLGNPVETSALSEASTHDDTPCWTHRARPLALTEMERGGATQVSVPPNIQRSVLRYRQEHDAYLRLVSHDTVGSFNPWTITESLAEELLTEALEDVAAEFQDACEDYAEAVFTSEFLQPT